MIVQDSVVRMLITVTEHVAIRDERVSLRVLLSEALSYSRLTLQFSCTNKGKPNTAGWYCMIMMYLCTRTEDTLACNGRARIIIAACVIMSA